MLRLCGFLAGGRKTPIAGENGAGAKWGLGQRGPAMDLDQAAALMAQEQMGGAENGPATLGFYHALAQAEVVMLLASERQGDDLAPQVFDLAAGRIVLGFDSIDRLAAWAQDMGLGPQPYASLPGRVVAQHLARAGDLGLGLNFGAGTASEMVLPPQAMGWLSQMLDVAPLPDMAQIAQVLPLGDVPAALRGVLARAVVGAGGLAARAILAQVQYRGGARAHILAFYGADPRAHAPLAHGVAEALAFSGLEAAALDVIFPESGTATAQAILAKGRDIPLPAPPQPEPKPSHQPRPPGMDPAAPPKLR